MKSITYLSTAFAMAFASMAAEILLAQCTTILYGGTVLRYSTVIGLFVFSLGMGAAFWAWSDREPTSKTFWLLEILLASLALLLPIFVFPMDNLMASFGIHSPLGPDMPIGYLVALTIALLIGWLAGMELPVLLMVSGKSAWPNNQKLTWTRYMVGFDFIGTVAATLVVPVFLYPAVGIVGTAAIAGGLNAVLGWWVCGKKEVQTLFLKCLTFLLVTAALLIFLWREEISQWLASEAF